jgi:hypothetical protein
MKILFHCLSPNSSAFIRCWTPLEMGTTLCTRNGWRHKGHMRIGRQLSDTYEQWQKLPTRLGVAAALLSGVALASTACTPFHPAPMTGAPKGARFVDAGGARVQAAGRLVQEEDLWVMNEGRGQVTSHALPE